MKLDNNRPAKRLWRGITFFLFFNGIGLAMSWWFGLGWFVLFQTLSRILFALPRLYIPTVGYLWGKDIMEEEKIKVANRRFTSPAYARGALFFTLLTVLVFWKANIPINAIIEMVFR